MGVYRQGWRDVHDMFVESPPDVILVTVLFSHSAAPVGDRKNLVSCISRRGDDRQTALPFQIGSEAALGL